MLHCHLRQVALRAAAYGNKFGAAKTAALAGWLHDLGKYSDAYQTYIGGRGPGGVDHSTAGAQESLKLTLSRADKLIAELVAYASDVYFAGQFPAHDLLGTSAQRRCVGGGRRKPALSSPRRWLEVYQTIIEGGTDIVGAKPCWPSHRARKLSVRTYALIRNTQTGSTAKLQLT